LSAKAPLTWPTQSTVLPLSAQHDVLAAVVQVAGAAKSAPERLLLEVEIDLANQASVRLP
jgi:hypothetical protein